MITLVRAINTCESVPSQWDAWDENGQYYYLRYRFGRGTVSPYADPDWYKEKIVVQAGDAAIIHFDNRETRGIYDGYISLEDFAECASIRMSETIELVV